MIVNANRASYYSRPDDVIPKLNEGGFKVYTAVLKEFSGFFLKIDESSLALSPSQANQEYVLPADCTQIVHLAERLTTSENWHEIVPAKNLENVLQNQLSDAGIWSPNFGGRSAFEYFGPFLDSAASIAAAASQIQKIRIAPITDVSRFVQLCYSAKWMPLTNAASSVMLPDEGTYAMESYGTAYLLQLNGDSLADSFITKAQQHEASFLSWIRQRQIQQPPQSEAYLEDYY